jgi:hypothetical protein
MKSIKILGIIILGIILLQSSTVISYAASQDVAGEYRGTVDRDTNIKIILNQHNIKLSGTLLLISKKNPQEIVYLDIKNGVVNDSTIIFNCSAQRGFVQAVFKGQIDKNLLTGILTMSGWSGSFNTKIRAIKVR